MSPTQRPALLVVCLLSAAAPAGPPTDRHGDPLPPGAAARLGTVRFRHGKPCSCAAFSPDGKLLASGSSDGTVRLWEVPGGKPLRLLKGHEKDVSALAFSPDGKRLVSGGGDNVLRVWDLATGKEVLQIKRPQRDVPRVVGEEVSALAFSPDGKTLAGSSWDYWVCLWDAASGKELRRLLDNQQRSRNVFGVQTGGIAFSPDGKTLAAGCSIIRLWDSSGRKLHQFAGREYAVSFAFSPDSKTLALTSAEFDQIRLVDVAGGRVRRRLSGGFGLAVNFSSDGKFVFSVGPQLTVWEAATGKKVRQARFDVSGFAYWFGFSSNGKLLAVGGREGHAITLLSLPDGKLLSQLGEESDSVSCVAFAPDGKTLAAAWEGRLYLWQPGPRPPRLFARTDAKINCVTFSPEGKEVVTGGADGVVRGFETATGKEVRRLIDADEAVGGVAFSADGKLLAAGSGDLTVHLWDASTGKVVRRHKGKAERDRSGGPGELFFPSLAFSPDGKWLATALQGDQPQVWETATGKEVRLAMGDKKQKEKRKLTGGRRATSVVFSPDGRTLAAGSSDGSIRLWEPATGKFRLFETAEKEGLPGGGKPFIGGWGGDGFTIAFSPDGRTLASWNTDRRPWYYLGGDGKTTSDLRLWEVSTGQERGTIAGHTGGITCAAFAPDGRSLVSGSEDTTLLVWDVVSVMRGDRPAKADLSAAELDGLWADLAGADARKAFRAVGVLAGAPGKAVPFLKGKLTPVVGPDARRLARLIADLDAARFGVRQRASAELEKLGELAEEALRKAAKESVSAEVRLRAGRLLEKLDKERTAGPERLRQQRALEALEHTGTAEAQGVLSRLAQGAPGAWLTEEAKAALRRRARP